MWLYSNLSHFPEHKGVFTPERASMEPLKASNAGGLNQEVESSMVPTTLPIRVAQIKCVGPRTPRPFEQGFWAFGMKRNSNHQNLTWPGVLYKMLTATWA